MHPAGQRVRPADAGRLTAYSRLARLLAGMAKHDFQALAATGLLEDVEGIVVGAYQAAHPEASRPAAYRWLRYEDPDPVARLAEGVRRLRRSGANLDAGAVDKACAKASQMGLSS
jgi:hypothetical protein